MAFPSSLRSASMWSNFFFPLFFIMRMFADLVLTPYDSPYDLSHYYTQICLLVSWNPYFTLLYTEMAEKVVRIETFWRTPWPVFSGVLHGSHVSQVERKNRFGSVRTGVCNTFLVYVPNLTFLFVYVCRCRWILGLRLRVVNNAMLTCLTFARRSASTSSPRIARVTWTAGWVASAMSAV